MTNAVSTLHVSVMYIPSGYLHINHTVIVDRINETQVGTVECGNGGQYLFTNGTTVFGFSVRILNQRNVQIWYYGDGDSIAYVEVSGGRIKYIKLTAKGRSVFR